MSLAGWRGRLAAMLVRMYPRSWRGRYGDELLGWVDEGGLGPVRALDSVAVLRFGSFAVAVVAAAMVVMLVATVTWGMVLRSADPALFHSHEGLRAGSTAASWVRIVALMAAASALAVLASPRGLAGSRGARAGG